LYIYLPPSFLKQGDLRAYFVADDGSTYASAPLSPAGLSRASEGQVYPPRTTTTSSNIAQAFTRLNRKPGGMVLTDPGRFGGAAVLIETALFTGPATFQTLGGIVTTNQPATIDAQLQAPDPWPAFTFAPSKRSLSGGLPDKGMLSLLIRPLSGTFSPAVEMVLANRSGSVLLVYLPELPQAPAQGVRLLVADDGSTYFAPTDTTLQQAVLERQSLDGLVLARAAQGQVLPIPKRWPLQQRYPLSINLCRRERIALLSVGQLGIDPELGRFALPPDDPALGFASPPKSPPLDQGSFSVDYVEAFSDFVGAVNSAQRPVEPSGPANRFVSRSGDADGALVHSSLADAVASARDNDVIEIIDSATYETPTGITLTASTRTLTIRAAVGQRPCLTFYRSPGQPSGGSLIVGHPMSSLVLNGLLISGGPVVIREKIGQLTLTACTLDPVGSSSASIIASDQNAQSNAVYLLSRCITGGAALGQGIGQLIVADSILDQRGGAAISGAGGASSSPPDMLHRQVGTSARAVQLERVTVLGTISCTVLNASESLLDDVAIVLDQQSGCVRFTRFETGSRLPRRYRCVPDAQQARTCGQTTRCLAPSFNSRRFGRPDYAQLAPGSPEAILTGAEDGGEVGAFAGARNTIRLLNLKTKLQEFMPVGVSAVIIAET
jgi:hypothetical protein